MLGAGLMGVAAIALAGFISYCHVLFECGCKSWWNGAAQLCNIHAAAPPHCPWCSYGWWGTVIPLGTIWLVQAAILLTPSGLSPTRRILWGLAAFPAVGALAGLAFASFSDYPTFLYFRLPE